MLISAYNLSKRYDDGRVPAVEDAHLELEAGEFVALMGPSGSGKSTLLQLIGALDEPDSGQIRFRGQTYTQIGDLAGFRARQLGFIFQSFQLLSTLTAIENVQLPMLAGTRGARERRKRAAELLTAVGLQDRLSHRPTELSGGERQRVAIARALANDPTLLLADEPTGSLDSGNARRILELLRSLHRERELTILMVTHDHKVAATADRCIHMLDGHIVDAAGSPA